jgi:hypothetical protein
MFHEASESDQQLLAEWRWLLGGLPRLAAWSSGGDLFIAYPDGSVALLDPGAGDLQRIADSLADLRNQLEDERRSKVLLQTRVVEAFEAKHGLLPSGRCLSYTTLPIFGGEYTIDNRFALTIKEHAGLTGDIHRQIRDFPEGTKVQVKTVP